MDGRGFMILNLVRRDTQLNPHSRRKEEKHEEEDGGALEDASSSRDTFFCYLNQIASTRPRRLAPSTPYPASWLASCSGEGVRGEEATSKSEVRVTGEAVASRHSG
jgi:hypothetical protein